MNAKRIAIVAVVIAGMSANTVAINLAQQGKHSVDDSELRLSYHALTDKEYERVTSNRTDVREILKAVLNARVHTSISTTNANPRLQTIILERSKLDYDVAQAERKAREWAEANEQAVLQRAKEMFLSADEQNRRKPQTVDFQHVFFDLSKRDFNATVEKIRKAQNDLAAGVDFSELAKKYSDDAEATKAGGVLVAVPIASMDDTLQSTLIKQLKENEVSQPIASRRGLHIVKLLNRPEPAAVNFEEVKEKYVQAVIEELKAVERTKIQRAIEAVPLVIDEEALTKFTRSPSPEQIKQVRQQVIEASREAKKQKARNLQSPMDAIK